MCAEKRRIIHEIIAAGRQTGDRYMIHNRHVDAFANGFLSNPALSFEERTGLGIIEMAKYIPISFNMGAIPS